MEGAGNTYYSKVKVKVKSLSPVRLFVTPWTVAYQASPSMGFSTSPGDLPDPGIEPGSPALEAGTLTSDPPGKPKRWIFPRKRSCFQFYCLYNSPAPVWEKRPQ